MAVRRVAQIGDLVGVDPRILGPLDRNVGGADLGEVALIGDREDDAAVGLLEHIGVIALVQPRHDDVAALDQPHAALAR